MILYGELGCSRVDPLVAFYRVVADHELVRADKDEENSSRRAGSGSEIRTGCTAVTYIGCSKRNDARGDCPHFSHSLDYFRVSVSWADYFRSTLATKFTGPQFA